MVNFVIFQVWTKKRKIMSSPLWKQTSKVRLGYFILAFPAPTAIYTCINNKNHYYISSFHRVAMSRVSNLVQIFIFY